MGYRVLHRDGLEDSRRKGSGKSAKPWHFRANARRYFRTSCTRTGAVAGHARGCALIDAHAGAIGTIGSRDALGATPDPTERLALIMGTSACIMATTRQACFVPGLWGPYFEALLPGFWLNEGGQSAGARRSDYLMRHHASWGEVCRAATEEGLDPLESLERRILKYGNSLSEVAYTARIFMSSRTFSSTARLCRPERARRDFGPRPGWRYGKPGAFTSPDSADWAMQLPKSWRRSRRKVWLPNTMVVSGGASRSPLVRQIIADTDRA